MIKGPRTSLKLERGVIRAAPHVHVTPVASRRLGLQDGDRLEALILSPDRPVTLPEVKVCVSLESRPELHLDVDEARALGLHSGDEVELRGMS